jgi:hypothetical protein
LCQKPDRKGGLDFGEPLLALAYGRASDTLNRYWKSYV